MKKISQIFGLLLMVALTVSSCSSSDGYKQSEYSFNGATKLYVDIKGFENQRTTSQEVSEPLDTLLKSYVYLPPITNGKMHVLGNVTSMRIDGLREDVTLKNFILKLNDIEYKFGDISSENSVLYSDATLDYFTKVFDKMIFQQRLAATVSFTPSKTVSDIDNVKLYIIYGGQFFYWK